MFGGEGEIKLLFWGGEGGRDIPPFCMTGPAHYIDKHCHVFYCCGDNILQCLTESKSSTLNGEFDFLIFSELLRGSLEEHVSRHQFSVEEVLQIECVQHNLPPTLSLELDHGDWVSAIHCYKNL